MSIAYVWSMLLTAGSESVIGTDDPRLRFGEEPKAQGGWAGRRLLYLEDRPAYELSFWCGTCGILFRRLDGANATASVGELSERLNAGLDDIDTVVVETFAQLLDRGRYLPLLLEILPTMVSPLKEGDYFAEEQVSTWGVNGFWGLPEYPHTPYYRTYETAVEKDAHLYEFVVPMVPPSWNDPGVTAQHADLLTGTSKPTAVAVSTLDVCAPATDIPGREWYHHWGLTHFLLDGHHKVQAAAETRRPLRLLALLSLDASLAVPEQIDRLPALRRQAPSRRQGS